MSSVQTRRICFLKVLLPALGMVSAGCGRGDVQDGAVHLRLSVFSGASEQDLARRLVAGFEKAHPGIKVAVEAVPQGDYAGKLGMQSAAGTLPDVVFLIDSLVPTFARYRVVQDLWPYVRQDGHFKVKDIYPTMLENGLDDRGNLLMLPRELGVVVMFYNRTLLRRAGLADPPADWTRQQFLEYARRLTVRDGTGHISQYGFDARYAWPAVYAAVIAGDGGRLMSRDGSHSALSSPASLQGLHDLVDLVTVEHVALAPEQAAASAGFDSFVQGRVAMKPGVFPWVPNLRLLMKRFDWDVQVMPGGRVRRATMTGTAGYGMSATTRHPREAWEFLSYAHGPDGQRILASFGAGIPSLISLRNDPSWRGTSLPPHNLDAFLESVKFGITWRGILLYARPEVDDVVKAAFDRALTGQETVEQSFSEADRRIDEVIKRDREDE